MTIKEAILKSLDDLVQPTDSTTLCDHILQHNYYEFKGKTPAFTVIKSPRNFCFTVALTPPHHIALVFAIGLVGDGHF